MSITKKIWPHILTSILVIVYWRIETWSENYGWNPKGNELAILDSNLTSIFFYKIFLWLITTNLILFGLLSLKNYKMKSSIISIFSALLFYISIGGLIREKCAIHYYSVFLNQSRAESLIIKPIEEAGYAIGEILTEQIENKEMKSRRYAILGLEKIDYKPATDLMGKILFDTSENYVYRMDAYNTLKAFKSDKSQKILMEFHEKAADSIDLKINEYGER